LKEELGWEKTDANLDEEDALRRFGFLSKPSENPGQA